jgi:hypothetical protein
MDKVQNPSNSEYNFILKLRLHIIKINLLVIKCKNVIFVISLKNILGVAM